MLKPKQNQTTSTWKMHKRLISKCNSNDSDYANTNDKTKTLLSPCSGIRFTETDQIWDLKQTVQSTQVEILTEKLKI